MRKVLAGLLALIATTVSANAAPILLNFDTDLSGNPINIPPDVAVNAVYSPVLTGATFSPNAVITQTGTGVPSLPNFATSNNPSLFFGVVRVDFATGTDFVGIENVTSSNFTISAFDAGNTLLGSSTLSGFPQSATLSFGGIPISYVTITGNGAFGFDNFRFQASPTPEPLSVAVFGGLIGVGGLAARRRMTA